MRIVTFGLFILFVFEPFRLCPQEDDAAGGLPSEFDSDLKRKNIVHDEFSVTYGRGHWGLRYCGIAVLVSFSCGISVILILNCVIAVFSESAG